MIRTGLTDNERAVIAAIQLEGDSAIEEVARKTNLRPHTVRRVLQTLRERSIIIPITWINSNRLGYSKYKLFFSIATKNSAKRAKAENFFLESGKTVSFSLLGGKYEYMAVIATQSHSELTEFLIGTENTLSDIVVSKAMAVQLRLVVFHRKYIHASFKGARQFIFLDPAAPPKSIDDKDHKILLTLNKTGHPNIGEISRRTGIPANTIRYRVEQLEKDGVILGRIHAINPFPIGALSFHLLIATRGLGVWFWNDFFAFCEEHPNIVVLIEVVGAWDLEVVVEVSSASTLRQVVQDIYQKFGEQIHNIESLTLLEERKDDYYPGP